MEEVLEILKQYHPKASIRLTILKGTSNEVVRFFVNWPKNKGSMATHGTKSYLCTLIINKIYESIRDKILVINRSNSSKSIYFNYKDIQYRLSDHPTNRTDAMYNNILIDYKTNPEDIIKLFK